MAKIWIHAVELEDKFVHKIQPFCLSTLLNPIVPSSTESVSHHVVLLPVCLMPHLRHLTLAYLSIFICPSFTPASLSVRAVLRVFPSLLSHFLSDFLPHMWFCSPSLAAPSLPLLLFSHPSLTYGFSLWVCVCLVLPRVHWGSLPMCV